MTEDGSFDEEALPRLERMVGPKVLGEVLDLYLESAPNRVRAVREGLQSNDLSIAAHALHDLKSSAGMIGAAGVQRLAEEMELLARQEDAAGLRARFESLESTVARATDLIEAARARRDL